MKLNWFSPLPPARTDIAHYTKRILPALQEQFEVMLWTDQAQWNSELEKNSDIRHYHCEQMPWVQLNQADLTVFNIGNNSDFHSSIWQVSQQHSGIVILHDFRLQHFFAGLYRDQWEDREGYMEKMEFYYGKVGREAAYEFWYGNLSVEHMSEHYPLTHLSLENALGIIVHSRKNLQELRREHRWPVSYIPLPYPAVERSTIARIMKPPYRLIVFGYIGQNRRLDEIFEALAVFKQRERFHLDVYGELWDRSWVYNRIRSLGIKHLITLHGFVSEKSLDKALSIAHLAFNLRYPDMGEASGSQLRIWDHALPSLVTKGGWYEDISEEAVAFVHPGHEIADIQAHLASFLDNPARFAKMGENGRQILEKYHSPGVYAKAIAAFVANMNVFLSHADTQYLVSRVGAEMSYYTSEEMPDEVLRKAAQEIYLMAVGEGK